LFFAEVTKKQQTGKNKYSGRKEKRSEKAPEKNRNASKQKSKNYLCIECCGIYGDASDAKIDENWMSCQHVVIGCMHESCFLCHDC